MHHSHRSASQIRRWLAQFLPRRGYKRLLDFLPFLILGMIRSSSCHLSRIGCAVPMMVLAKTSLQRVWRWICRPTLANSQLLPRVVHGIVEAQAMESIIVAVDRTEWKHANYLYAAISYRGRAIPIAVMLLSGPKATNVGELRQLLAQVALGVPPGTQVIIVGDREFGNIPAIRAISKCGWDYCLRFKKDTSMRDVHGNRWRADTCFPKRGSSSLTPDLWVTGHTYGPVNVATIWDHREDEPWMLVSNLPVAQLRQVYRRRMRIEEMFSDFKERAFDLEATRLREPLRLLNLAVLLALTYIWLLIAATTIIKRRLRRTVDPAAKRALSYTQIALRFINNKPPEDVDRIFAATISRYVISEG